MKLPLLPKINQPNELTIHCITQFQGVPSSDTWAESHYLLKESGYSKNEFSPNKQRSRDRETIFFKYPTIPLMENINVTNFTKDL